MEHLLKHFKIVTVVRDKLNAAVGFVFINDSIAPNNLMQPFSLPMNFKKVDYQVLKLLVSI